MEASGGRWPAAGPGVASVWCGGGVVVRPSWAVRAVDRLVGRLSCGHGDRALEGGVAPRYVLVELVDIVSQVDYFDFEMLHVLAEVVHGRSGIDCCVPDDHFEERGSIVNVDSVFVHNGVIRVIGQNHELGFFGERVVEELIHLRCILSVPPSFIFVR